jgi:glycerophosphoryl diester phosphodiesterase
MVSWQRMRDKKMLFVKQGIQNYLTYAGSFLKFKGFSFSTYNVNAKLITEAMIQDLKAKGKKVNLFTVNDPQEFDRFVNAGVDGIITDFPQEFVR